MEVREVVYLQSVLLLRELGLDRVHQRGEVRLRDDAVAPSLVQQVD